MPEILLSLLSAIVSIAFGGFFAQKAGPLVEQALRRIFGIKRDGPTTYAERVATLTESLRTASTEVDAVLNEIAVVARERADAVAALETQVHDMAQREDALKKRIDELQNVPLPVAEHFAALAAAGDKRSAKRDYLLFGMGVIVSTLLSIIFFLLQGR
jgi:hypothetical protein